MHPLSPDLSKLPTEEITNKYNELVKRMLQAQRMGNGSLINQVGMLLEDYRVELSKRQQKILDDANKNANFKNIIDIN
jgi:predicted transcriptional regulator of viral defense system